jgi:propionate CoA-transferase
MSKVISASAAAALIKDGATVGASALTLAGWPEELAIAVEKRFLASGHPAKLTLVHASGIGDWKTRGTEHFAHHGMVTRWIGGHTGLAPGLAKMVVDGDCEGYCMPQGVVAQLWRDIAAHRPGLITKTGLGTFVDPRLQGGKLNKATTKDLVKVIQLEGEEWMFYPSFNVDVAIIRGTTADANGNMTVEDEGALLECLPLAQAAKNTGGIVIAEVAYLAKNGTLNPKDVRVPGVLIDYLVVSGPGNHWQSAGSAFNPGFSGRVHVPLDHIPEMPMNERLIIARRAAMELEPGDIVNLGIGVPTGIASLAALEGIGDMITLTTEVGSIGGIPAERKEDFGMSLDAEAFIEPQAQFDWYSGGGLNHAFLGAAQVGANGDVNVSMFNGEFVGAGGFIDITQHAKKLVYCGSFTAGGLKVAVIDGKLSIVHEGKAIKYVKQVEQVTFSGAYATKTKQPVLYITERAVFELQDGHLTLIEVAPGIDVQKDILAHMDFVPKMAAKIKSMPVEIFKPKWGGLRALLQSKVKPEVKAAA